VKRFSANKILAALLLATGLPLAACGSANSGPNQPGLSTGAAAAADQVTASFGKLPKPAGPADTRRPNVYAATTGPVAPQARGASSLVYVPVGDGIDIIDQRTRQLVAHRTTGAGAQSVQAGWDLSSLLVANTTAGTVSPVDPRTAQPMTSSAISTPTALSYTPDGRYVVVLQHAAGSALTSKASLSIRDLNDLQVVRELSLPCVGLRAVEYTADSRYLIAGCQYSGRLVRVDLQTLKVDGVLDIGGMPQDLKLDPYGQLLYVADASAGGLQEIDLQTWKRVGFLSTGRGATGIAVSRNGADLYVSNRFSGTISVVDAASRKVVANWPVNGQPALLSVSASGSTLWVSNQRAAGLWALSTADGKTLGLVALHGPARDLLAWPQPGRYSLGFGGQLR
jgi:YVTN family beta-propeller protein